MRVVRGSYDDPEVDRAATHRLVERVRTSGDPTLRVWTPPRQVAFGLRDAGEDGYERAREAAKRRGYPPVERDAGGRAVAYTGSTVAFALAKSVADERRGIGSRYDDVTDALRAALAALGVDASAGEPSASFCPGSHSLQAAGKIAGLAQRVRSDVALVGGVIVTRDHDAIAAVLQPVYDALGLSFDPDSVGSVERAGGDGRPDAVVEAIVEWLVDDRPVATVSVRET